MRYTEGTFGRVFFVRVDHGEDLLETLERFVFEKDIRMGFIQFLVALKGVRIVTGPREAVLPPEPSYESFEGGWEVVGFATITPGNERPHLHYHASVGRGKEALTGCLREIAMTYIIVEAMVIEVTGIHISRHTDSRTGLELPDPGSQEGERPDQ